MNVLTVFTPTYNRAYCLGQLYKSLCNQTVKDFLWLIIDDGSSDNTKELVDSWIEEGLIDIQYVYQNNQGMHGAHNTAYKNINTDYNVCIDSDDSMPFDAVEIILDEIKTINDEKCAGIVALDAYSNGQIIGTSIPENIQKARLSELYALHKVRGDKKLVYKTKIINQYPEYPIFERERFVPLGYKYTQIDQDYYLKPLNKILCLVEYLDDGSTKNIFRQYRLNPKGFAYSRIIEIEYGKSFKVRLKNSIHLVSSAIFLKDFNWITKSKRKNLMPLAIPLGIILNIYIRMKLINK